MQFSEEKKKSQLEKQIHQIKFGLSEKSLQFFPEYQKKVEVCMIAHSAEEVTINADSECV